MAAAATTRVTTPRGWHLASTGSSRARLEATPTPRGWEHQKRGQAGLLKGNRGSRPLAAPVLIPLPRLRRVGPSRAPNLPLLQRRATGLSPRRRAR